MESQKLLRNCQKIQKGCYLNFKSCYLNSLYSLYSSLFALTNLALNSCSHIKVVSNHSFLFMEMNQQRQPSCHLCRRFSRLPVLILDNRPPKHIRNCIDRSNFFWKSLTLSCLMCVLSLKVAKKIAQKGKNCLRLSEPQEVSPNAKRCSKVSENNPDRPYQKAGSKNMLNSGAQVTLAVWWFERRTKLQFFSHFLFSQKMENRSGSPESKSKLIQKQFFFNLLNPKQKWFFKNFFFQFKLIF